MSFFLEVSYSFFDVRNIFDILNSLLVEEGLELGDHRHRSIDHVDELLEVTEEVVVVDEERSNFVGVLDEKLLSDEESLAAFAIVGGDCSESWRDRVFLILCRNCLPLI